MLLRSISLLVFLFVATFAERAVSTCWAHAPTPNRRFDAEGTIAHIVPATEEQKKDGILATLTLKDQDLKIQVTRDSLLQSTIRPGISYDRWPALSMASTRPQASQGPCWGRPGQTRQA